MECAPLGHGRWRELTILLQRITESAGCCQGVSTFSPYGSFLRHRPCCRVLPCANVTPSCTRQTFNYEPSAGHRPEERKGIPFITDAHSCFNCVWTQVGLRLRPRPLVSGTDRLCECGAAYFAKQSEPSRANDSVLILFGVSCGVLMSAELQ
jgi:hypothetical protein